MAIKEIIELTEKIFANPHGCYRKIKCRKKKIAFNGEPQPVGWSTQLDLLTQNCRGATMIPPNSH